MPTSQPEQEAHENRPAGGPWTEQAITDALTQGRVRGVRLWAPAPPPATVAAGAVGAGWRQVSLDTEGIASKADYIHACAEQVPLPDYLGHNWDALEEALGDLGVSAVDTGAAGLLVVWRHWADFARADAASFQVALAIWRSVVADWRERLPGAAVALAYEGKDIADSDFAENVVDELRGMSRVRQH